MILMKTTDPRFKDIWEKDGIAPFNSTYVKTEILKYSRKLPLRAIGFYSGTQDNKKISLLEVEQINQNLELPNDIQIKFKFIRKLELISKNFDIEISKSSSKLLLIMDDSRVSNILNKFGIEPGQTVKSREIQTIKYYDKKYLNPEFYYPKSWIEFEKVTSEVFNMLGFQVKVEGHKKEKKRLADIYCYSPPIIRDNRILLIIDCKHQDNYFINTADERAMKEYIVDKKSIIEQEGVKPENLLFLYIALGFSKDSYLKVQEISISTNSFGALLNRDNLLFLLEKKLRMGYKFYLEYFPKLFKNQEITIEQIDYVYKIEDEFIS